MERPRRTCSLFPIPAVVGVIFVVGVVFTFDGVLVSTVLVILVVIVIVVVIVKIEGIELSGAVPEFGPGRAQRGTGPTPAAVVANTPATAAPTPTPAQAQRQTQTRTSAAAQGTDRTAAPIVRTAPATAVSTPTSALRTQTPSVTVIPGGPVTTTAPGRSTATGTAASTTAHAGAPAGVAGPGVSAARINQTAGEAAAGLTQPDRPIDQAGARAPALSQATMRVAREQLAVALAPLAQQAAGGMIGVIDVAGVRLHDVEVSWTGRELRVGYFGIERLTAPGGAGAQIQESLEHAVAQVARQVGAPSARVFVRKVVNDRWRAILHARGYQPENLDFPFG